MKVRWFDMSYYNFSLCPESIWIVFMKKRIIIFCCCLRYKYDCEDYFHVMSFSILFIQCIFTDFCSDTNKVSTYIGMEIHIPFTSILTSTFPPSIFVFHLRHSSYENRNIYTYIGEVCVSMNPYRPMNIYGPEHVRKYKGESRGTQRYTNTHRASYVVSL